MLRLRCCVVALCAFCCCVGAKRIDFFLDRDAGFPQGIYEKRALQGAESLLVKSGDASVTQSRTAKLSGTTIEDSTPCPERYSDSINFDSLGRPSRSLLDEGRMSRSSDDGGYGDTGFYFVNGGEDYFDDEDGAYNYEYEHQNGAEAGVIIFLAILAVVCLPVKIACLCGVRWFCRLPPEARQECIDVMCQDCRELICCCNPFKCLCNRKEHRRRCCCCFSWALGISHRRLPSDSSSCSDASDSSSRFETRKTTRGRIWDYARFRRAPSEAGLLNENRGEVEMESTQAGSGGASMHPVQSRNGMNRNEIMAETESGIPSSTAEGHLGREESVPAPLTEYHSVKSFQSGNLDNPAP